jgi:hypothetical protein
MDYLEKSQSWKEEQFDLVLQYLRTVLLKRELTSHILDTCLESDRNIHRWRFSDIHKPCRGHATPEPHTCESGDTFTPETRTAQAQCY